MSDRFLSEIKTGSKTGMIKKKIIKYFLLNGNCSIPDLAKELGLSVPTVSKYLGEMSEDGYVSDYGKVETKGGRHPNTYGLNPDACYFIGIDIKWFSLNIGLVDFAGEIIAQKEISEFRFENTPAKLDEICTLTKEFIKGLDIDRDKIININVNVSGRVNHDSGYSFSILNFEEKPLAEVISDKIGLPVTLENDTRAMAYGEFVRYYPDSTANIIFVNASWGIGIGLIIEGRIYYGRSGYAGEFGHMSVYNNEIMCHCGKKGCVETEASGSAVAREIARRINEGASSVLSERVEACGSVTLTEIIDAIEKEDMLTIEIVEEVGQKIGKQVANLINVFNPDLVIIGGTLALTGDFLMQPLKTAIRKYSLNLVSKDTKIVTSKLLDNAGVTGACMISRQRPFEDS